MISANFRIIDYSSDWLDASACNDIIKKFGSIDGVKVIDATDTYLDRLDSAKASALSSYINEDPMMVCSLGLEPQGVTMPVRWLVGDGTAYINTGYQSYTDAGVHIKTDLSIAAASTARLCGNIGSGYYFQIGIDSGRTSDLKFQVGAGGSEKFYTMPTDKIVDIILDGSPATVKNFGTTVLTNLSRASLVRMGDMALFSNNTNGTNIIKAKIAGFSLWSPTEGTTQDNPSLCYIPCQYEGNNGMLDLVTLEWFGNANSSGSFTIPDVEYEYQQATYLTAAGFGNIRVTAASMGKAYVFGRIGWLWQPALQAIMVAFGADGAAVINATNAYLNGIAAQGAEGKSKAQALAAFINQYPYYAACVGGLYPAVDYIESDHVHNGISYLIIDYYLNNKSAIDVIFSGKTMSNNRDMLMGANNATGNCESYSVSGTEWMIREGGSQKIWDASSVTGNKKVQMTQDPSNPSSVTFKYLDAGTESTQTMTRGNIAATTKLYLFTIARASSTQWNDGMRIHQFNIYEDSGMVVGLAPSYKSADGTIGVYDFINNKFYANAGAGSFTKGADLYQTP